MSIPHLALAALAIVLPFETGCDPENWASATDQFHEDFQYTYDLKPGGRLSVENFNGSIEILGWEKNSVQVTGTKHASSQERLNEIKIEAKTGDNALAIRTVRPQGWGGTSGAKYFIRVPRQVQLEHITSSNGGVRVEDIQGDARLETSNATIRFNRIQGRLEARTSNGGIEGDSVTGDAVARSSNGGIRLDRIAGGIEARTSNAGIHVRVTKPKPNGRLIFESSNGSIELELEDLENNEVQASTNNSSITLRMPASTKARLRASTSNSSISSDFDITTHGTLGKNHLEGDLNGGGPLIDLHTQNGSIRIQKL